MRLIFSSWDGEERLDGGGSEDGDGSARAILETLLEGERGHPLTCRRAADWDVLTQRKKVSMPSALAPNRPDV